MLWDLILPGIAFTVVAGSAVAWRFIMRDPRGAEPPEPQPGPDGDGERVGSRLGTVVAALALGCVLLYGAIILYSAVLH